MNRNDQALPERVRAQLLAAGVPPSKLDPGEVASLFPDEFNVAATGLGGEDLAKVLLYLVERNIIPVPETTFPAAIRKVGPGWHFCQFYRDFNQLLFLVTPYVAEGLEKGEACLWVLPKAVTREMACAALAKRLDDVDARLASGQLEILAHPDWYLDASGQLKSFEEIAGALLERQDRALANGFKLLRAAGDTGWVTGTQESRDFIDYEMKVNEALKTTHVAAICTYRADVSADELVAIVTAHQDALSRSVPA